jgi:hypothetical protein
MKETFSVRRQALVDEVELVYVRASCSENGDLKKSIIWKRFTCDKADYPGQRRSQCVFWLRLQSVAQKTYREHESFIIFGRSADNDVCRMDSWEALTWTGQG